jgi:phage/plasmid primase-like uncharacterized protein/energy-coupling factor transporter ATP-binding protein EcfA2
MSLDAFSEMSRNLNHEIQPFSFDGEIKRFKTTQGKYPFWAIGREFEYKGNTQKIVKYGDWRNATVYTWRNYETKKQTPQFMQRQKEVLQEMLAKEKYETQKKNSDCKKKWKVKFKEASKSDRPHEYMLEKDLNDNYLAKVDSNNTLLIPVYDESGLVGCQLIFYSNQESKLVKRFTSGIKLSGSFCPFGKIKDAEHIYVSEGFSTAATIYEATNMPSVCAWNANNLYECIKTLRRINPKCKIIIGADNDTKKEAKKIGIKKAFFCKSKLSNVIIKIPKFEDFDSNNTDFNDLMQVSSIDEVKKQLEFSESDFTDIKLLGHDDDKYYYLNTQSMEFKALSVNQHNELHLMSMASQKYWGERYRFRKDKEGNETGYADIKYAIEKIFEEQRQVGWFNHQNIRGYGSWIDNGRIVINLGDKQIVDGEFVNEVKNSKYLYTTNFPMIIDWENPLKDEECKKIVDTFKLLNYKNPGDYIYLTGWLALAQIFNAVDWRFQLWITGNKGSGKTEILKMLSSLVFDSEIYQSITEASIRQHLKNNAMPMIVDEAEPNSIETRKRMNGVMEVIRQCSSRMNAKTIRGTASGTAIEYNINSLFCLASIQTYFPTQADVSRFFVIEMNSNANSDIRLWPTVQKKFDEIKGYAPRLFSRMVQSAPNLRYNISTIKDLIISSDWIRDPRQADQISCAMASYFALHSTEKICDDDMPFIMNMVSELNLGDSDYESDNTIEEAEKCFDAILQTYVPGGKYSVLSTINSIKEKPSLKFAHEDLASLGMRYFEKKKLLFVASNNIQLKRSLNDTMYCDYGKVLTRHNDFQKSSTTRINGRVTKGVFLNL